MRIVPFIGWILTEGTNYGINADYAMNGYSGVCLDDFTYGSGVDGLPVTDAMKGANGDDGDRCGRRYIPPPPCRSNPCQNGANCTDTGPYTYECTCAQDIVANTTVGGNSTAYDVWSGKDCDVPMHCSDGNGTYTSGPCANAATCYNIDNDPLDDEVYYVCSCVLGWQGTNCTGPDPCALDPCNSQGSCQYASGQPGGVLCTCYEGYTGLRCENELPCHQNNGTGLCENNSTCTNDDPFVDQDSYRTFKICLEFSI